MGTDSALCSFQDDHGAAVQGKALLVIHLADGLTFKNKTSGWCLDKRLERDLGLNSPSPLLLGNHLLPGKGTAPTGSSVLTGATTGSRCDHNMPLPHCERRFNGWIAGELKAEILSVEGRPGSPRNQGKIPEQQAPPRPVAPSRLCTESSFPLPCLYSSQQRIIWQGAGRQSPDRIQAFCISCRPGEAVGFRMYPKPWNDSYLSQVGDTLMSPSAHPLPKGPAAMAEAGV